MTQRVLDDAQIHTRLQQRGGIAVAQRVDRGAFLDTTVREGCPEGILDTIARQRRCGGRHADTATPWCRKKPDRMTVGGPVLAEEL